MKRASAFLFCALFACTRMQSASLGSADPSVPASSAEPDADSDRETDLGEAVEAQPSERAPHTESERDERRGSYGDDDDDDDDDDGEDEDELPSFADAAPRQVDAGMGASTDAGEALASDAPLSAPDAGRSGLAEPDAQAASLLCRLEPWHCL